MKFAKELEHDLVPEWRVKYLDYKTGKRKIKAVERALRSAESSPYFRMQASILQGAPKPTQEATSGTVRFSDTLGSSKSPRREARKHTRDESDSSGTGEPLLTDRSRSRASASIPIPKPKTTVFDSSGGESVSPGGTARINYGSFVGTPPERPQELPQLNIGAPALDPSDGASILRVPLSSQKIPSVKRAATVSPSPTGRRKLEAPPAPAHISRVQFLRNNSMAFGDRAKFLSKRLFSLQPGTDRNSPVQATQQYDMGPYQNLQDRKDNFQDWMAAELFKVEEFYKLKETQASQRLHVLRDQLHEMRDRRIEEVISAREPKVKAEHDGHSEQDRLTTKDIIEHSSKRPSWLREVENLYDFARGKPGRHLGPNTKALTHFGSPNIRRTNGADSQIATDSNRDFVRRPTAHTVPYSLAKRKLKLALQEYYRGLELLKSYVLLNRKAFRKIEKKYDKASHSRPAQRFMTEKVNKSWFVQSEVLDSHMVTVEDLYARYFEKGHHKIAVGKLRSKPGSSKEWFGASYRGAMMLGAGLVFGIQALTYAAEKLNSSDAQEALETSYLLQLYGGIFLGLVILFFFTIDCSVWAAEKINYTFIFEFDMRHHLDWRQLLEIPSALTFLLALFMWLNFADVSSDVQYIYYFPILLGIMVFFVFLPLPILYHHTRKWITYSLWRLFCAGLYPVEFRDFFLGDIFCSLTYCMGNIELFFCLYAGNWGQPTVCNSGHSRLLGFFSCLPGIWRFLQCLRRYYDTRNIFPHLANGGKYMCTILFYMCLSFYRIDKSNTTQALFLLLGVLNSIYTSVWDIAMDWSLGNPYAKHKFLRDSLGFGSAWPYYIAMFIDPILRFNWIFYAIFVEDIQHSAILSFIIALSEIVRRGIWIIFRMENEHCTNVGRFRASRDIPLPYEVESEESLVGTGLQDTEDRLLSPSPKKTPPGMRPQGTPNSASSGSPDIERADIQSPTQASGASPVAPNLSPLQVRRRRTGRTEDGSAPTTPLIRAFSVVGNAISRAHAQDFERKRRPGEASGITQELQRTHTHEGSSDESDADDEDGEEEVGRLLEVARLENIERGNRGTGKQREE